jgi:hypothetical protein
MSLVLPHSGHDWTLTGSGLLVDDEGSVGWCSLLSLLMFFAPFLFREKQVQLFCG